MYGRRQCDAIRNIICSLGTYWHNVGGINEIELCSRHRTAARISIHNLPPKTRRTRIETYRFDDSLPLFRQFPHFLRPYFLQLSRLSQEGVCRKIASVLMQRDRIKHVIQKLIWTNPNGYFLVVFARKSQAVSKSRVNSSYIDLNRGRTCCECVMFIYVKTCKHIALSVITQ